MFAVAAAMVAIFFAYIYKNYWLLKAKIRQYGIETDATVCRIEKQKRVAYGSGTEYPVAFYYVVYERQDGIQSEARLLNPKSSLTIGERIRIRYLEEKNDSAVLVAFSDTDNR